LHPFLFCRDLNILGRYSTGFMIQFTSKVQHNTYEKGEFTDEQPRTLEETIQLIKSFPWDNERTLTDIQLTGPSVTIINDSLDYLKIGLFFNSKYCLYYLDSDNHLYEYHATTIEDACSLVSDFFQNTLDLNTFEKHFLSIGSRAHFETNYFEYREKPLRVLLLTIFLIFYSAIFFIWTIAAVKSNAGALMVFLPLIFGGVMYAILGKIFYNAYVNRNCYLQISKGSNTFTFGYNGNDLKTYNKADVVEIVSYENRGSRNPNFVSAFQINFKDSTFIKFTNMLISSTDLFSKFNDARDNCYVNIVQGKGGFWKALST